MVVSLSCSSEWGLWADCDDCDGNVETDERDGLDVMKLSFTFFLDVPRVQFDRR